MGAGHGGSLRSPPNTSQTPRPSSVSTQGRDGTEAVYRLSNSLRSGRYCESRLGEASSRSRTNPIATLLPRNFHAVVLALGIDQVVEF